ncbi:MAG TPA: enolase C-terminal domain-like protein [Terriglobales bacterium]|nr:enolase C-terminal domain-like protein [Terriglobales bacterium]
MPPISPHRLSSAAIAQVHARAYTIPTATPEADGTIEWDATTIVVCTVSAAGETGMGYTYASPAAQSVIEEKLGAEIRGLDALDVGAAWSRMVRSVRNIGLPGIAACAVSAVDTALWDLKAKLLGEPLARLLGMLREEVPLYGSGGFTSYSVQQLQAQLGGWAEQGITRVKMKVGTHPQDDLARVRAAREAIGPKVELFVDANGAYTRKQALRFAERFAEFDVRWFEEPVSSDDLEGLRLIRDRAPASMDIAAGEYGYTPWYFRQMLAAGAVDVLQADATRCCGFTGLLAAAELCRGHHLPLSAHTAPALHLHACCAAPQLVHLEYFYDHARIERMLFDGAREPVNGALRPDLTRPGTGLEFKQQDAARYAA